MTVRIEEVMRNRAIFATVNQSVGHLRTLFEKNKVGILPVVNVEDEVVGVVSIKDLVSNPSDETRVRDIMISKVYTVPPYEKVEIAARMMRNHKIHHLIVTQDKKLKGVISSFDLLKLIENKKFVMKSSSTTQATKSTGKRIKEELTQ